MQAIGLASHPFGNEAKTALSASTSNGFANDNRGIPSRMARFEYRRLYLTHWHTYPKTPKMNAHCERFNRTIQEEYINYHKGEMIDLHRFNLKLFDWLVWYNAERPHWSLNFQSPIQFLTEWNRGKSRMYWLDTRV